MPNNTFDSISPEINAIGTQIVDSAIKVHKAMGPGLLESVYEECMTYLRLSGLRLGYLINFNVPLVKNGIKRMVM